MRLDGVSTVTAIGVASFAIDRIVTAIVFLFSMLGVVEDPGAAAAPAAAAKRSQLVYYLLSAVLVALFLWSYPEVGILSTLGFVPPAAPGAAGRGLVDTLLTFIVLVGGADRVSAFLKPGKEAPEKAPPQPLEVTGRLVLEEPDGKRPPSGS